jgi:hypothetical protein
VSCRLGGVLSFSDVVVTSNCSIEVVVDDVDVVGDVGGADDAGGVSISAVATDESV